MDPDQLEADYKKYMANLKQFAPDGVIHVDSALLEELNLHFQLSAPSAYEETVLEDPLEERLSDSLTNHFYVIESFDKLTLFNKKFSIWIVPKLIEERPATYALIASNHQKKTHLEVVFSTTGAYNHSQLVLRILEKFLEQIEENEKELQRY